MTFYLNRVFICLVFFFYERQAWPQSLPETIEKKIDSLFETWNNTNSPGCAVGVVRNDSLVFSKGYGMANLEHKIPITGETTFYMCSLAKQFTAYCTVLLARQRKLSLDEDIRVYLPWTSDFGKKITIRNLLNHTSGLRDDVTLAAISGLGINGMITQDLVLNILKRQRALNFEPGEQYSYSNSNYVLLAEIIKIVSGKSLQAFADSSIFKPLGMSNTRFIDNYVELVKGRAFSYQRLDSNHYTNDIHNVYTLGDGGLFSNVADMAKWVSNFYNTKVGDSTDITQLTEKGRLNSKREISYASGMRVENYKGHIVFAHNGVFAGYRTFICIFPDLKIGVVAFGNIGEFRERIKALDVANLFIDTIKNEKSNMAEKDSSKALLNDTTTIKKIMGSYIADNGMQIKFRLSNNKIYAEASGQTYLLLKGEKDTFSYMNDPGVKLIFRSNTPGDPTVLATFSSGEKRLFERFTVDTSQADHLLRSYIGMYYSPELDCRYNIILKDHHLFLSSNRYNDTRLTLIGANHLVNNFWFMNHLSVIRDNRKQIIGFEVSNGRVMHLRFNKVDQSKEKRVAMTTRQR